MSRKVFLEKILTNQFLVPFGRFRLNRQRAESNPTVLIGREGERAFMIDFLCGTGERGSILVTGQRGVGKTTFVEHCLREYENSRLRRFLASGAGRSLADIAVILIVLLTSVAIGLVSSDLLEFMVAKSDKSQLLFLPIFLLSAVCAIPAIWSFTTLRTVIGVWVGGFASLLSLLTFICFLFITWGLDLFGGPVQTVCVLIFALGGLAATATIFSFWKRPFTASMRPSKGRRRGKDTRAPDWAAYRRYALPRIAYIIICGLPFAFIVIGWWLTNSEGFRETPIQISTRLNAAFTLAIWGVLGVLVSFGASALFFALTLKDVDHRDGVKDPTKNKSKYDSIQRKNLLQIARRTLLFPMGAFGAIIAVYFIWIADGDKAQNWRFAMGFLATLSVWIFVCYLAAWRRKRYIAQKNEDGQAQPIVFVPPAEALVIFKTFAALVLSMQLLYPLGGLFASNTPEETVSIKWNANYWGIHRDAQGDAPQAGQDESKALYLTLFRSDLPEQRYWLFLVPLFLLMLMILEYEWINRAFLPQRQASSLDRGPRPPFVAHHPLDAMWIEATFINEDMRVRDSKETLKHLADWPDEQQRLQIIKTRGQAMKSKFLALESSTFMNFLIGLWQPALVVRVNLGFDDLDHRSVSHNMLHGLRAAYRRKFMSINSPYWVISQIAKQLFLLFAVTLIARDYIDMPYQEEARNFISVPIQEGKTDNTPYCQWLEQTHEPYSDEDRLSLVPKALCTLSPAAADRLIPLMFLQFMALSIDGISDPGARLVFNWAHYNSGPPTFSKVEPTSPQNSDHNSQCDVGANCIRSEQQDRSISIRLYHVVLYFLILFAVERFLRRFSPLPYRRTYDRISELIDNLTLDRSDRKTDERRVSIGAISKLSGQFSNQKEIQTSRQAQDPRTIELSLMNLLDEMRPGRSDQSNNILSGLTIPQPQLHFVFDELDKVGGVVAADFSSHGTGNEELAVLHSERERAYQLQQLLSDLKRVISAAPARFIFVGGRVLHDEWIRDQARMGSRQPLLSSIFEHELYIPSLILDQVRAVEQRPGETATTGRNPARLDARTTEYVQKLFHSTTQLDDDRLPTRFIPLLTLRQFAGSALDFDDSPSDNTDPFRGMSLIDWRIAEKLEQRFDDAKPSNKNSPAETRKAISKIQAHNRDAFLRAFVGFLTYRSGGMPKKLIELLSRFVRPSASFGRPTMKFRERFFPNTDMLVFDEGEVYRVQFINAVFRHIERSFSSDLLRRDDKITMNTIFLLDFLMKMHNRAFSWSSLERLDELAHIHRAPDLRRLYDAVIGESAERFFHVVLNGLYTFRFRSEFAVEVRYLSRLSSPEMAALNFTLDESQELKTTYNQMLNASGDPNPDLIVALGELYEFDQAYDIARSYYNRALKMIDDEFARQFGVDFLTPPRAEDAKTAVRRRRQNTVTVNVEEDHDTMPFYAAILSRRLEEPGMLNGFMPWVVRRLRLMMSIGLTHEQSNDSERAQMSYHAAQAFAVSILEIINESERPGVEKFLQRQALKHLDLLFQPMFAAAWVEEKLPSGVDTALTRVELELHRLRRNLDFVNIAKELPEDDLFGDVIPETLDIKNSFFERGQSSNNSVVMSELHNKAGDLYFFKGREARSVSPRGTGTSHCRLRSAIEDEMRMVGTDMLFTHKEDGKSRVSGYLLMSHYHYALALHEVRRFLVYRRKWSRTFLDIGHTEQNKDPAANEKQAEWRLPTITGYSIPTYVALTIMSSLGDLSDVTLARASLLAIWEELRRADTTGKGHDPSAHGPITADAMREVLDIKPAQFATSFEEWLADTDAADSDKVRPVVSDFLGSWFGEEQDQKDTSEDKPAKLKLRFGKVSPHSKVTIVGLFASMTAARFATRANYPDTAGYEYQISAEHSVRLLKGFRSMMVFGKLQPQPCEHKGLEQIYPDGFDFTPSQLHLEYFAKIAEIGVDALTRQMASIENAYPLSTAKPTADAAKEHMAIEENLSTLSVATALALQLETLSLLETSFDPDVAQSGQMLDNVRESLKRSVTRINKLSERYNWFGSKALRDAVDVSFLNGQAYQRINQHLVGVSTDPQFRQMLQISMDRATCHAQLLHIVTQHRYPVLNNMRALKALIDDSIMSHFGLADQFIETSLGNVALWSGTNVSEYCLQAAKDIEHERSSRFNQARLWVEELIELETFVDASMNFPPSMMAETVGLLCVALTRFEPKIENSEVRALRPMARRYRWRAEQSFTMGRQYYQNISRLYYLFDDFNDRRRHANHGAQMCMADQLALLRFALDDRMSQV